MKNLPNKTKGGIIAVIIGIIGSPIVILLGGEGQHYLFFVRLGIYFLVLYLFGSIIGGLRKDKIKTEI